MVKISRTLYLNNSGSVIYNRLTHNRDASEQHKIGEIKNARFERMTPKNWRGKSKESLARVQDRVEKMLLEKRWIVE